MRNRRTRNSEVHVLQYSLYSAMFLFISTGSYSQQLDYSINKEIITQLPQGVTVVGLGDPTHQESTITKYRIDLIKKLVKEKGFKVIAIEGNIFEFHQAHESFIQDGNLSHYESAMYNQLNSKEMEALYDFVFEENKNGNPVCILGFDSRFSGATYTNQAEKVLNNNNILSIKERMGFVKNLKKASMTNLMALFRNKKKVKRKILLYSKKILREYEPKDISESFFFQSLKNLIFRFENNKFVDKEDIEMANNVFFTQEIFPNEKIILFGSSTHLLKNPKDIQTSFFQNNRSTTLGDELEEKLGDKYFYIAYTSLSGSSYDAFSQNKTKEIEAPIEKSIEKIIYDKNEDSYFITQKSFPISSNIACRFLAHNFVVLNLWEVIDGLVLIKNIEPFRIKKR